MDCFGDSSSDEEEDVLLRDESCGVCSFHSNTEASLLMHVRNTPNLQGANNDPKDVLNAIDDFCMSRHWMMHVGPDKGVLLKRILHDAMNEKASAAVNNTNTPFVAVELGTYCGYASILLANECRHASTSLKCHWYTVEIERAYAAIAKEMIQLSGMDDVISVHQITFDGHDTNIVDVIRDALKSTEHAEARPMIDFLFIDHDKDAYKSDLCKFESFGLIGKGTKVVADNVIFANIKDYIDYVQERQREGVVQTRTIPCCVEYCGVNGDETDGTQYQDGIEVTDYLRNP
jgi:catechol O-methyltransferase